MIVEFIKPGEGTAGGDITLVKIDTVQEVRKDMRGAAALIGRAVELQADAGTATFTWDEARSIASALFDALSLLDIIGLGDRQEERDS